MSTPIPVKLVARPVDPKWHCHRTGDCCRSVDLVTMTHQEAAAVQAVADAQFTIGELQRIQWQPNQNPQFIDLVAGPCPFLRGTNVCSVHEVRPFNCRRFGCMRPNPKTEPLQMAPLSPVLQYGTIGCSNLRERLVQSKAARRRYAKLQQAGMRWAYTHGWRGDEIHTHGTD